MCFDFGQNAKTQPLQETPSEPSAGWSDPQWKATSSSVFASVARVFGFGPRPGSGLRPTPRAKTSDPSYLGKNLALGRSIADHSSRWAVPGGLLLRRPYADWSVSKEPHADWLLWNTTDLMWFAKDPNYSSSFEVCSL